MGYPLAIRDETQVYEKMIGESGLRNAQLSPLALRAAATFAILTRLSPASGGWTIARKLRFYDGRFVEGVRPGDMDVVGKGEHEDGSFGFSPRYVMNQLSRALSSTSGCLTGGAILDVLWEGLTQRAGFGEADRASATEIFAVASTEYDEMVKRAIRRAMVPNFERQARTRAANALKDLESWQSKGKRDMEALRRLERAMDVPYFRRDDMRTEFLELLRAGDPDELHRADPRVEEALERSLLPTWSETASALSAMEKGGSRTKLRNTLVGEWGFPEACAEDVIEHGDPARDRRRRRSRDPPTRGVDPPAQGLYEQQVRPREWADVVVLNDDPARP